MHEAIRSVVVMFLLKEGPRNNNQDRADAHFSRNIRRALKINLMYGDSSTMFGRSLRSIYIHSILKPLKIPLPNCIQVNTFAYVFN
jgi:hypothetical protein